MGSEKTNAKEQALITYKKKVGKSMVHNQIGFQEQAKWMR